MLIDLLVKFTYLRFVFKKPEKECFFSMCVSRRPQHHMNSIKIRFSKWSSNFLIFNSKGIDGTVNLNIQYFSNYEVIHAYHKVQK